MADVERPMLSEVLACVKGITDPAEAQERLVARGLLTEGWCGDVRRGWAQHRPECPGCGVGCYPIDPSKGVCMCDAACDLCNKPSREVGASPCTIPDLVAVASLGWPAIHRAETLARDACAALREYGCPQPERVVWRVGKRKLGYLIVPGRGSMYSPHHRAHEAGAEPFALWRMGVALDAIDCDAVRIAGPPVGDVR